MTKRTWFSARKANEKSGEIAIYNDIGAWGITSEDFRNELQALGDVSKIDLRINSAGGDVFDGVAIYNLLIRHPAKIVVTVDGIAASIASMVAMAGDEVVMPDNTMMMIHDPMGEIVGGGTADDMREIADLIDRLKENMISAYMRRSNLDRDGVAALMSDETWLSADEAVKYGFADRVVESVKIAARALDLDQFVKPPGRLRAAAEKESKMADAETTQPKAAVTPHPNPSPPAPGNPPLETPPTVDNPPPPPREGDQQPAQQPQQTEPDIAARLRDHHSQIAATCDLAGFPSRAAEFIASGKPLSDVLKELRAAKGSSQPKAPAAGLDINTHNHPQATQFSGAGTEASMVASMKNLVDRQFPKKSH